MKPRAAIRILVRTLDTLSYLVVVTSWAMVAAIYLPIIQHSQWSQILLPPDRPQPVPVVSGGGLGVFEIIFVTIIVAAVIGLSIYALVTFPRTIRRAGDRIALSTARASVPLITRHQPLPTSKRRVLTRRIIYYVRACFAIIPIILSALVPSDALLAADVALLITTVLGGLALVIFSISHFISARHTAHPASK